MAPDPRNGVRRHCPVRPSGRILAGRAVLLTAGIGTVLGAGAGNTGAGSGFFDGTGAATATAGGLAAAASSAGLPG